MRTSSRWRESAATLIAIGAVFALTTALAVGTVAFLDEQGTKGIRTELDSRAGADLALRASLTESGNPERQDRQVRAAIASTFASAHIHLDVVRTLSSHVTVQVASDESADSSRGGSAQSMPDFLDRAKMVSGEPAATERQVAVQADAAATLGLTAGDEVLIAGERFTVSGTWRAKDVLDPRWYGDVMVETGFNDDFGPFVIDEGAWSRIDEPPTVTWTVLPAISEIDATNSSTIVEQWGSIRYDWRRSVNGLESLTPQNQLVQTLRGLESRLDGLRAVEPVIFTLLAAASLVAVAVLIGLIVTTRRRVTSLYWARGDSRRGIALRLTVDVAVAGMVGAIVGGLLAGAGVAALWGVAALTRVGALGAETTLFVLAGAVVLSVVASRQGAQQQDTATRSLRRVRRAALPGVVVLVTLAAALSVWQLQLYGSPLTPTVDGTGGVDPIAVIAPALSLAALVLLCVIAFPRISAINERRAGSASVTSQLAARGISRRIGVLTAPLVLIALAAGCVTVAAAYSATWNVAFGETAALRAGSALHVDARPDSISPDTGVAVARIAGADKVAPLEVQPLLTGLGSGTIVGATPQAVGDLASEVSGKFDPRAAAHLIRAEIPGPTLPTGASALTVTMAATGFVAPPALSAYLADSLGFLTKVDLELTNVVGPTQGDQEYTYTTDALPTASGGSLRIASFDFGLADQTFETERADLHLESLDASAHGATAALPLTMVWIADSPGLSTAPPTSDSSGAGFFIVDATPVVRLTPSMTGTVEDRPRPPILVSQELASRLDLEVGDSFAFSVQDGIERLNCVVAGIVPAVPGAPTESAVLIDLAVIQHFQLRNTAVPAAPRDLWVAAHDPDAMAAALRPALPANTRIVSALDPVGRQILGSASLALWAAAGCIVLLAVIGIASSAAARLRSGRNDVAVLRALGLTARDQARIFSGELRVVLLIGLLAGLLAGCAVALLTIPYFARAAVTLPYLSISTGLRFDVPGWLALVALLCVCAAAAVGIASTRMNALVHNAIPGEDTE